METTVDFEKRDLFVERVHQLISMMQKWVTYTGLYTIVSNIIVEETIPGKYTIEMLEINDKDGKLVAKVIPVGAYVIAAEGRVDIKGYLGKESVVFLKYGGPSIVSKVNGEVDRVSSLYDGITAEGWFWIEDKRMRRAYPFDEKIFLELITRVSDYEFR
ncbi:MAG: hypothetical protein Q8O92_06825 [Candidatus Latescibacter sp.]|nr:hypothetical protein [Candidatus Latescibacter sp.]